MALPIGLFSIGLRVNPKLSLLKSSCGCCSTSSKSKTLGLLFGLMFWSCEMFGSSVMGLFVRVKPKFPPKFSPEPKGFSVGKLACDELGGTKSFVGLVCCVGLL